MLNLKKYFAKTLNFFVLYLSLFNIGHKVLAEESQNIEWFRNFGGSSSDYFYSTAKTSDGGFVAVGETSSSNIEGLTNLGGVDALIVKYDKLGNKTWAKNFGGSRVDYFKSVVEINDGGLIAVGAGNSTDIEGLTSLSNYDAIIVKYDSLGNKIWAKNFGGSSDDYFYSVAKTSDGGFIAVGESSSTNIAGLTNRSGTDAIIVKFDSLGNQVWLKNFAGGKDDCFSFVVETDDKEFVAVGDTYSTNISSLTPISSTSYRDAIIVKYDSLGNELWARNFGGSRNDYFKSVAKTNDKGLVAVGYTYSTNISDINSLSGTDTTDAIIVKYSKDGDRLWAKNFGGATVTSKW